MKLLMAPDRRRYSRKSITWFAALCILVLIIGRGSVTGNWPPSYVFEGLVALIVLVIGGTIIDKKLTNPNKHEAAKPE